MPMLMLILNILELWHGNCLSLLLLHATIMPCLLPAHVVPVILLHAMPLYPAPALYHTLPMPTIARASLYLQHAYQ